ncbi:uncharacterized protein UBRO2_04796 [Ustilago bromivora]|uniref:Uncharacterized protein n=1 Tax=Ustilago bromivora TaxID=307758 RepID=A0A8H8TUG7_9BASI|nr:uncharacterized protein UBRO2_04796 [Ustilago bromivora]
MRILYHRPTDLDPYNQSNLGSTFFAMDRSALRAGGQATSHASGEATAGLPCRPEGAPQQPYIHAVLGYGQGGQRGRRGRGRGSYRARGQRGTSIRGPGGHSTYQNQSASYQLSQSEEHFRAQQNQRDRGGRPNPYQETLGQSSFTGGQYGSRRSHTGTSEIYTSDGCRHLGPLGELPTAIVPDEGPINSDVSNLWDRPTNDITIAAAQQEEPQQAETQHARLQVPRAASVPASPIARPSPAVTSISLPTITSTASAPIEVQVLRLTKVIAEAVQSEERGFRSDSLEIEHTGHLPTPPISPGPWEALPHFDHGHQAQPRHPPGMVFAGFPPPLIHGHDHYHLHQRDHSPSRSLSPSEPHVKPPRSTFHPQNPYQFAVPMPFPPPHPPLPPYMTIHDPAFHAVQDPLPIPPPGWRPIPYLRYWGPDMVATRPFYDVPMFAEDP